MIETRLALMLCGVHADPLHANTCPVAADACVMPPGGRPVQLVNVPDDGVPSAGVTRVGEVARTGAPLPVAVVQMGNALAPPPTSISVVAPAASV